MSANSTNSKISNLVSTQVPFFVRNDHQLFVKFLEYYYEYLEQNDKVIGRLKNLKNYKDIDRTTDEFSEYIYNEFMKLMPKDMASDRSLILKNIKDFYRARGTEKSIKFLLRAVFGNVAENITFYYPKLNVLKASDGKWFIEKSLRLEGVKIDGVMTDDILAPIKFINTKITGNTSGATALVERVEKYYEGGTLIQELKVSNQLRDFSAGEAIWANYDESGQTHLIQANTFSGVLNTVTIINPGTGYSIGDEVIIESETGSGGSIIITDVSEGGISAISIVEIGAGFKKNDIIQFTGGDGSGANANVTSVNTSGFFHPNTYNIISSTIQLEANTPIGNSVYSNLNASISDPANDIISNSMSYFTYSNTGPLKTVKIITEGNNYVTLPTASVVSNTRVRELGILGRMQIIDGGEGYTTNDWIEFTNVFGGYGSGAYANVTSVDANGVILAVNFQPVEGHITGGSGYSQSALPLANVVTTTGTGANIQVKAILADGDSLSLYGGTVGEIRELTIQSKGRDYTVPPTLNLSSIGDGTAQANVTIITGVFTYPGRWLNDDGKLSSYNFLQDEDYYQNFSYVVRSKVSIEKYRSFMKDLVHPAGMKLFAEYPYELQSYGEKISKTLQGVTESYGNLYVGDYVASGNVETNSTNVLISVYKQMLSMNGNVYIEFTSSNNSMNLENSIYSVVSSNTDANTFYINVAGVVSNSNGSLITSV